MRRVLEYIDEHLDGDLSIEVLSDIAAFSKHHFHRQFSSLLGITAHQYVQWARMKRASYRLAFRQDSPVTEIALTSGYGSPEAFARAFKDRVGQSPTDFRNNPDWPSWHTVYGAVADKRSAIMSPELRTDDVKIVDFPETPVAVLAHRGDPAGICDTIRRFIAWRKATGLGPRISATFNILHCDPEAVAPEEYRLDLCAGTDAAVEPNEIGVAPCSIPGGRCAVLRLMGSSDDLRPAVSFLYAEWLPQSGEELRDFPVFVQRVRFFPDVPEHEAVTDIFLPLK
ncbi:MAG: AraC family transcriptional regulator [Actinomycetota bacterium]